MIGQFSIISHFLIMLDILKWSVSVWGGSYQNAGLRMDDKVFGTV